MDKARKNDGGKSWRDHLAGAFKLTASAFESEQNRLPMGWRAVGYGAPVLLFVLLLVFAWFNPEFNGPATLNWRSVLASAVASRESGDIDGARHFFVQVERIAVWQQDWEGLVAAACGIKKLDSGQAAYTKVRQMLFRAFLAAEHKQSRQGIDAVAKAFTAMGEHKVAEMVRAHARADWPGEMEIASNTFLQDCAAAG